MSDKYRPTILIFSVGEVEGGLKKIKEKADVHQASFSRPNACADLLKAHPSAQALWIVDPDIARQDHKLLSKQVVAYVRNGGTAIIGGWFVASVTPLEFDEWMESDWNLPWRFGQYETTTVVFQSSAVGPRDHWRDGLAAAYSQKGVFLKNVAATDSWYASPPGSKSESRVFGPLPIESQTSMAFGRVGQGWLGFTGDINNVTETNNALLAMMGLNGRDIYDK
ncbi:uncharacterized protein JN550_009694 [Neoarthrinium moseri]|uniref:uncharacterized protein n=1 Tax=Neoarthrinium moseri TaxID=1658444 RepID=UPI001FDBD9B8|nr:uncharacterized protein JN550_009694 [Neoarthrinium moseri]KAI1863374.1 hypothetical protein JN550_009694 [Neoarthrinium moseri]